MEIETVDKFLARGGEINHLPLAGVPEHDHVRRKEHGTMISVAGYQIEKVPGSDEQWG